MKLNEWKDRLKLMNEKIKLNEWKDRWKELIEKIDELISLCSKNKCLSRIKYLNV